MSDPVTAETVLERQRTSFGADAIGYDAVRPDWPAATVEWLLGSPGATRLTVLDLGCGTGKGTRAVGALGHRVLGIDPSRQMVAQHQRARVRLPEDVRDRMDAHVAAAEAVPAKDGSLDAVVSFQAWHWFDRVAAAAECHRVLRPGGVLGLAWHHRDETVAWQHELARIVEGEHIGQDQAESFPAVAGFGPEEQAVFGHAVRQRIDDVVRHASTWSYVAVSPRRDTILDQVRALAGSVADEHGMVEILLRTHCHRWRRDG